MKPTIQRRRIKSGNARSTVTLYMTPKRHAELTGLARSKGVSLNLLCNDKLDELVKQ